MPNVKHCPVCSCSKTSPHLVSKNTHGRHPLSEEKFQLWRCQSCQAIFIPDLKIDDRYYHSYYTSDYYDPKISNRILFWATKIIAFFSFGIKQREILSYFPHRDSKVSVLDVGCGSGFFLAALPEDCFDRFGIEINKQGRELTKKLGIKVAGTELDKAKFGRKFDVITMWHVLEHVQKPNEFLKAAKKLLSPKGVLIFQTPNPSTLGYRIGKENWFHLDSPRHLILYNPKAVEALCHQTGFEIMEIKSEFYDTALDLFWSVRKSNLRFLIYPVYPLIRALSPECLTYYCKPILQINDRRYNQKNV